MTSGTLEIDITQLVPSPDNPRKTFNVAELSSLGASIRSLGIQVPLLVRPMYDGDDGELVHYQIVAGHRRHRAAEFEKLETVPCIVREMSDEEAREIMVVENLQRADLPPLEEADAYEGLLASAGSVDNLATRVGKPVEYVTRRLKLRTLTPLSRRALAERLINIDHALLLCKLAAKEQDEMLKWCLDVNAGIKISCEKVLEDCLERRHEREGNGRYGYWEARSVLDLKSHIEQLTNLLLAKAPWDLADSELVPAAGACLVCPKNTEHNTALFGDLLVDKASCTDSQCFDRKRQAFVQLQLEAVSSAGGDAVRLSWRDSAAAPKKLAIVKSDADQYLRQVFKDGQWLEAKKGSCAHVLTGVTVDYPRYFDIEDRKKRRPGMKLLVCVAPGCKVHPKAWEKAKKQTASNGLSREEREAQRKAKEEAYIASEEPIRAAIYDAIIKSGKVKHDVLFRLVIQQLVREGRNHGPLAKLREIDLKNHWDNAPLLDGIRSAKVAELDSWAFDTVIADALSPCAWRHDEVKTDRKELWEFAQCFGVDANAIAKKLTSAQAKGGAVTNPEKKEVAENRQSKTSGASNQKRRTAKKKPRPVKSSKKAKAAR